MKKYFYFSFVVLFWISKPVSSVAWGKKGHEIVAEITSALVDVKVRTTVQGYLGETTFEQASTWMDEMRSNHEYDYMKPWHYTNVEKGKDYTFGNTPDVVTKLKETISQLDNYKKLSKEDVKKNLLYLFHLAGDFHMPLHVGYGVDKGGNDVKVDYLGHSSNLHRVWDSEIIESEKITLEDCMVVYKNYSKSLLKDLEKINLEDPGKPSFWYFEPRALVEDIYKFKDGKIDQAYVDKHKKVVEDQLVIAGVRMAAVLKHAFKD